MWLDIVTEISETASQAVSLVRSFILLAALEMAHVMRDAEDILSYRMPPMCEHFEIPLPSKLLFNPRGCPLQPNPDNLDGTPIQNDTGNCDT